MHKVSVSPNTVEVREGLTLLLKSSNMPTVYSIGSVMNAIAKCDGDEKQAAKLLGTTVQVINDVLSRGVQFLKSHDDSKKEPLTYYMVVADCFLDCKSFAIRPLLSDLAAIMVEDMIYICSTASMTDGKLRLHASKIQPDRLRTALDVNFGWKKHIVKIYSNQTSTTHDTSTGESSPSS